LVPQFSDEADVILITSKNSIKALESTIPSLKRKKWFVVGNKTAKFARSLNIQNIFIAEGNAKSLEKLVLHHCDTNDKIYYPCGKEIAYNLDVELKKQGLNVAREIVYQVEYIDHLSLELKEKILANKINAVVFFSKKCFEHFWLLLDESLKDAIKKIEFIVPLNCDIPKCEIINISKFSPSNFKMLLKIVRSYDKAK
jgi:uroporphyrinogen-III synthase